MKYTRPIISTIITLPFFMFSGHSAISAPLDVAGSTTVQKRVLEPAKKAIKDATGISFKVRGIGSGGGFKELMSGKVMVSIASSPIGSLLKKNNLKADGTYQEHIIIEDIIVPIVNAKNAVKSLNWDQLAAINTGKVKNWKEVGGADCAIKVVTSHSGSATRKVFQKQVMKGASYVAGVSEVKSTRQEVGRVAKSKCAIGAVSEAFVAQSKNKSKVSVIKTKSISRPLSLITKGAPTPEVKKLIEFLRTASAKKHFK